MSDEQQSDPQQKEKEKGSNMHSSDEGEKLQEEPQPPLAVTSKRETAVDDSNNKFEAGSKRKKECKEDVGKWNLMRGSIQQWLHRRQHSLLKTRVV
jgi:hypothetical protein